MAENILFNFAEGIVLELGSFLRGEIGLLWGAKNDLQKLERTMSAIKAVLLDAEEKQAQDNRVKDWLLKLEGVVYDADDLVDDFHTESLRRRVMPGNKLTKKVCIFFSSSNQLAFRLKIGHKIKEIREALDEIRYENTFQLVEHAGETKLVSAKTPRETHSFVRGEDVVGRENEKEEILKLLLHDDAMKENVSAITIFGFGGLGKTTLAQLVFEDTMVRKHFELRLWTCVSEVFDLRLIVGNIIKSATNRSLDPNLTMDQLQKRLREEIDGKRYFLVLDDVWNEDPIKWHDLNILLKGGARGSRVLVTTRSEKVAMITHSRDGQPVHLSGLDEVKSWALFAKMAFKQQQDLEDPQIVNLGKAILEKCKGVPLAIKTIGSMLYFKNPRTDWLSFKDNELSRVSQQGDGILATLGLSYDHLPSYLKHCFAYCRLFPKDRKFDVQMLIKLWMAQGFIKTDQNQCLEDVGYGYFLDLLWRSFFQEAEEDEWGNIRRCKMHDLMHDLAISVASTRSVLIDTDPINLNENLVHLSFDLSLDGTAFLKSLSPLLKHKCKLRTLFCSSQYMSGLESNVVVKNFMEICSEFKSLRALDLSKFLKMEKLPKSLGELKHLRYLDLSHFSQIQELPNSITKLQNLQTLNLEGCEKLSSLPRNMHKMVSLRHLVLDGCGSLSHMPSRLGELTCLQTLDRFVVGPKQSRRKNTSIGEVGELRNLNSLRGVLRIRGLRPDIEDSQNPNLQLKQHLRRLVLEFEEVDIFVEKYEKSLELLQPHANLKTLEVRNYMGVGFASWIKSLVHLVKLHIYGCSNLTSLPEAMGNLSSLQSLGINGCPNLTSLPEAMGNLSSLQSLRINGCSNLTSLPEAMGNLSSLQSLRIYGCPNLTSLPEAMGNLSSLQSLGIYGCSNLTSLPEAMGNLSSLQSLRINGCSNLTSLPEAMGNLSSLQSLRIYGCPNLTSLPEAMGNLSSLQSLDIRGCPNLTSLPEGQMFHTLKTLYILRCPIVQHRYNKTSPMIAHIPHLEI